MINKFYICLCIEYIGTSYNGWQCQPNKQTVQNKVEEALFKFSGELISTICSGRTDSGVHATSQVINFFTTKKRKLKAWRMGLNNILPDNIRVVWAADIDEDFSARFSALYRGYKYIILNTSVYHCFDRYRSFWVPKKIDINLMDYASQYLLGTHDFRVFSPKVPLSKNSVRTIINFTIKRENNYIIFRVTANSFLHHMVRNIVGSLLMVGLKKRSIHCIRDSLNGTTKLNNYTIPSQGLYLDNIHYPIKYMLPTGK